MNQTIAPSSSVIAWVGATATIKSSVSTWSEQAYARLIGALFLLGFISYGVGFGLVTSVVGAPDFLATLPARQTTLVLGAFLMLLNSAVDVGKGVLFFPIIENQGKRTALAYLAAMILEVAVLAVGVLCLLMIVPLSSAAGADGAWATALGALLLQANTMAYQIAMATLAVGNVFLWALAFRTRLIPRWLSVWGVAGYVIFLGGAVAEIFGVHIGLLCTIAGGLFEVALGVRLLIKGFDGTQP